MYAGDLATACQAATGDAVRAIGWLEVGRPFKTGAVAENFVAALRSHVADPGRWVPRRYFGLHRCDLGGCGGVIGADTVIIPTRDVVYVAPELVLHYVEHHGYAPPAEFIAAVLACPEQASDAFIELVLPFASLWELTADRVRQIAAESPKQRALAEATKGQPVVKPPGWS